MTNVLILSFLLSITACSPQVNTVEIVQKSTISTGKKLPPCEEKNGVLKFEKGGNESCQSENVVYIVEDNVDSSIIIRK